MALAQLLGNRLLSKAGEVATADAVAGKKHIMIYFSAHWCPPCRGFTPTLVQAYQSSGLADQDTMVVFVSSDRDQKSFDDYYGEMPWHAVPFDERSIKAKLSQNFGVQGIPMLLVLDAEGNIVTKNGRAEYEKYLPACAPPACAPPAGASPASLAAFSSLFGDKLLSKNGEIATSDAIATMKHVLIYFSAHWCPPCRGFTPQLIQAYNQSANAGKDAMVVFVSSDRDTKSFDEYYGEMPWHALPFEDQDTNMKLSEKFGVSGIPSLVVLDSEANVVTLDGRQQYQTFLGLGAGCPTGGRKGSQSQCCVIS